MPEQDVTPEQIACDDSAAAYERGLRSFCSPVMLGAIIGTCLMRLAVMYLDHGSYFHSSLLREVIMQLAPAVAFMVYAVSILYLIGMMWRLDIWSSTPAVRKSMIWRALAADLVVSFTLLLIGYMAGVTDAFQFITFFAFPVLAQLLTALLTLGTHVAWDSFGAAE